MCHTGLNHIGNLFHVLRVQIHLGKFVRNICYESLFKPALYLVSGIHNNGYVSRLYDGAAVHLLLLRNSFKSPKRVGKRLHLPVCVVISVARVSSPHARANGTLQAHRGAANSLYHTLVHRNLYICPKVIIYTIYHIGSKIMRV